MSIEPLDVDRIRRALTTRSLGREFRYQAVVESTNDWAAASVCGEVDLPSGALFVAERQLRGRGTGGNTWESEPGGLWMSLVFDAPLLAQPLPFLPAVALVDALAAIGVSAHLKWPNDVLVGDKKVAGILIESESRAPARLSWIVGVGVNVGQRGFSSELAEVATSVRMELGRSVDREDLLIAWLAAIEEHEDACRRLSESGRPDSSLIAAWCARTRMLGRGVSVRQGQQSYRATARAITADGHLVVAADDGTERVLVSATDLDLRILS